MKPFNVLPTHNYAIVYMKGVYRQVELAVSGHNLFVVTGNNKYVKVMYNGATSVPNVTVKALALPRDLLSVEAMGWLRYGDDDPTRPHRNLTDREAEALLC